MTLRELQENLKRLYVARDRKRGAEATFRWFVEEVGELAKALRKKNRKNLEEEFSDCLAWLTSLATLKGIDLTRLAKRYGKVCPKCRQRPCGCPFSK